MQPAATQTARQRDHTLEYYIPNSSPIQAWTPRAGLVNQFSVGDLDLIVQAWKDKGVVKQNGEQEWMCPLKATKDQGHPQGTIAKKLRPHLSVTSLAGQWKELVHLVWWRWQNGAALIPADLHISHTDTDQTVLRLIAESRELNESRKYCHLFGWHTLGRCPHAYYPCT
jgi:hypothetical protein